MCLGSIGTRARGCLVANCPTGLSDFGLNGDVLLFSQSQWPRIPQTAFLVYRGLIAAYTLAWLIMSIVNAGQTTGLGGFFVFLTNWTYIVLSLYLVVAFLSTAYVSYVAKQAAPEVDRNTAVTNAKPQPDVNVNLCESSPDAEAPSQPAPARTLPVYFRLAWVLLMVALSYGPIITVIYWAFIFDPEFVRERQGGGYGVALTTHRHAFNSLFAYLDLFLSAVPVRFWHFVYPCGYGLLYAAFSLVYFWAGGTNPYVDSPAIYPSLLDWTMPGRTCLVLVVFALFVIIFHSVSLGWYKLRMLLARRLDVPTVGDQYSRAVNHPTHAEGDRNLTDVV